VDAIEEDVKARALSSENTQKYLDGKQPRQVIYVPGRLVNIVM
jgi:leucyl-tRNA synthetase